MEFTGVLAGKALIAMPGMDDSRFARSVVLLCAHGPDSAMGLILNKPLPELNFRGVLDHLGIAAADRPREIRVVFGGPVERGRGFVLHSPDWGEQDPDRAAERGGMLVPGGYRVSVALDVLEALAQGTGPERALLALGYAGWGAGQLEGEIMRNDWLVADITPDLVFGGETGDTWALALKGLGIDPLALSSTAGRA